MKKHLLLLSAILWILTSCKEGKIYENQNTSDSNSNYPSLMIAQKDVKDIQNSLEKYPLWDQTVEETIADVALIINDSIEVPIPKDMAGGYTHTRHKNNYLNAQKAAVLYQTTQEERYAVYVKTMLMEYAKIYKSLPLHP